MQIDLPREVEETIVAAYSSGDIVGVLKGLTAAFENQQVRTISTLNDEVDERIVSMRDHVSAEQLVEEQGNHVVTDYRKLNADFAPEGETSDDFMGPILLLRNAGQPRGTP